jgi:ABC-type lipopolysaccharide export system ATPase subunit
MALGIRRRLIVLHHGQLLADGSPDEIRNDTSVKRTTLMLEVDKLNAWYGRSHVVQDVSFKVARGEIVTLPGRNGARDWLRPFNQKAQHVNRGDAQIRQTLKSSSSEPLFSAPTVAPYFRI